MHQHHPGCPARPRIDRRVTETVVRPRCSLSGHRRLPKASRHTYNQQLLQVSCPAVEQDTELPSSSGRSHNDSELIHALFQTEQPTLVEMPDADYAHELRQRVKAAGSLPLLCDLVQQEAPHMDHISASQALYRLSILCHAYFTQLQSAHLTSREAQQAAWVEYVEPALQTLGQMLIRHIHTCDSWAVALSFWSYGKLQCSDEAVFAALCERGLNIMHEFTAVDCAQTLVGISKLRVRPRCQREFLDHLLSHTHELLSNVGAWRSCEICSVLWALSRIGAAGPSRRALLEGLLEMTLWRLQDFQMQELCLIVYSCGRLRLHLPAQLAKITNYIAADLRQLSPVDAAHVMWGCAKVDFKPSLQLLEGLPAVMLDRISEFKPQEVCNLLYGYGHLRHQHPALLEGVAKACTPRLHEFSTQDLCVTIWSYGMVHYCPEDTTLFDTACRVLMSRSNSLLPIQLTMAVKGFARCNYQPAPEFMRQIAQQCMQKLHQFSPTEYAQLLYAYAALGYRDVQLFETVVAHTITVLQTHTRRLPKTTVDTILWSCARVGFWPQMLVDTAEMRGLYVRSTQANPAEMEPLGAQAAGSSSSGAGHDSSSSGDGSSAVGRLIAAVLSPNDSDQQQANVTEAVNSPSSPGQQQQQDHVAAVSDAQPWQQPTHAPAVTQQQPLAQQQLQQQSPPAQQQRSRRLFSGVQQPTANGNSLHPSQENQQQQQQPHSQLQLQRPPLPVSQQQLLQDAAVPELLQQQSLGSDRSSSSNGSFDSSSSSGLNGHQSGLSPQQQQ